MDGDKVLCGATTRQGAPCRWPKDECKHHKQRNAAPRFSPVQTEPGHRNARAILERRDLREVAWWLIEQAMLTDMASSNASAVATALRVLASLGTDADDEAQLLQETEVRGLMIHGIPPRTEEEWEIAGRLYPEETLAEVRRWPRLGEVDRSDDGQPLRIRDVDSNERQVAGIADNQH